MHNRERYEDPRGGFGAIRSFWRDEDATTSLEYALMLALVGLSAVVGYQALGGSVGDSVCAGHESVSAAGMAQDGGAASQPTTGAAAPG